jgi:hypothetical protein
MHNPAQARPTGQEGDPAALVNPVSSKTLSGKHTIPFFLYLIIYTTNSGWIPQD